MSKVALWKSYVGNQVWACVNYFVHRGLTRALQTERLLIDMENVLNRLTHSGKTIPNTRTHKK